MEIYNPVLKSKPQIIVANKMDLPGAAENLERLKAGLGGEQEIFAVSAATGQGLRELMLAANRMLKELPAAFEAPRR